MPAIDVRLTEEKAVDTIIIADDDGYEDKIVTLQKAAFRSDIRLGEVALCSYDEEYPPLVIKNEQHALHLIKGIEKALELKWWSE